MYVKDFLPLVKAGRHTYYNLDNKAKLDFQKRYNDLKRFSDKEVHPFGEYRAKQILSNCVIDYVKKVHAIHELRLNIIF